MSKLFIDYVELAVGDLPAAQAFYESVFEWAFNDYGGEYAGVVGPGGTDEVGGMYSAETQVAPLPMLRSPDLDATVAAVTAAGGTIVEPPHDYPGGRRFSFTDPSGNRLAVYQPSE